MANRFWVGGTATWDGTAGTKWATTSGGAGGAAVPTSADDVFFDGNSGTGTITLATGQSCLTLDFTGFTGTFAHNSNVELTVAGNLYRLSAGMTFSTTASGTTARIDFTSTSGTCLITTAGKSLCSMTFNGVGGTFQLQDALTTLATHTVTLTNGTLDTNGQTCSWGLFASANANTRVLTLGASQITLTGSNSVVWNVNNGSGADATALTLNAGTSTITVAGTTTGTSTNTFSGGGKTYNNVVINGPIRCAINYTSTFANLTINGVASTSCRYILALNQTVTGAFTCTGASSTQRPLILGAGTGSESTRRTITVGSVSFSNCDFQSIGISGVTATGTRLGDATNNSGITFDAPRTVYWRNTLGGNWSDNANWSLTSGGAGGADFPLPQDTVVFDANSLATAGQTVTADIIAMGLDVSFAASATSPTLALRSSAVIGNSLFGSLTLKSGMTITGSDEFYLRAASAKTITSAGVSFSQNFVIIAPFGSYSLVDALTVPTNLTFKVQFGTFDANGQNVTCGLFNGSGTKTRTITMGTGTWTLTGVGSVWNFGTTGSLTLTSTGSTLVVSDTSSAEKVLSMGGAGGAERLNILTINPGGTGPVRISNSTAITITTVNVTGPKTVTFSAAATYTITNLNITSSKSQPVTFLSSTPGTQYTLSVASGTVGSRFMSIFDCIGTGGATFVARESYGNNTTGWTIVPPRRSLKLASTRGSVYFPNNAGYVVASSANAGISASGSFSFMAWIRPAGYTATRQDWWGFAGSPINSSIGISSSGKWVLSDAVGVVNSTAPAIIGRMTPVVITWDSTNARGTLYVEGYTVYTRTGTPVAFADGVIVGGKFPAAALTPALGALGFESAVYGRAITAAEAMAWSQDGTAPDSDGLLASYGFSELSGSTVADGSGNGKTLTITSAPWTTDRPVTARVAASGRVSNLAVSAVAASGTITVTDYEFLAGKESTNTVTITDWTAMAAGTLDILGMIPVVEGVDFTAATSNEQTAINMAAGIDTAVGDSITAVVGTTITLSLPGENDGGSLTWDSGGVTLGSATFSGGFDATQVNFGATNTVFGAGTAIGANNDEAATNLAATINGAEGGVVTAAAVGPVVTVTYDSTGAIGNTWVTTESAANGGTTSGGLTFSGGTLEGGVDAVAGRNTASNRVQL